MQQRSRPSAPDSTSDGGRRWLLGRRDLLTMSAWSMLLSAVFVSIAGAFRLLFPRVQYTPPTTVVLGRPGDFTVGEVNERWKSTHGIILFRDADGFYALRSVCTHLGCVPHWRPSQQILKCPCHGSGFRRSGMQFEGPAPRPLERLGISLDAGGRIVVDTAVRLRQEKGEWDTDAAFLRYPTEGVT